MDSPTTPSQPSQPSRTMTDEEMEAVRILTDSFFAGAKLIGASTSAMVSAAVSIALSALYHVGTCCDEHSEPTKELMAKLAPAMQRWSEATSREDLGVQMQRDAAAIGLQHRPAPVVG